MTVYKVPGVFIEPEAERIAAIKLDDRKTTGFIGIAEKGPINKGIRIHNFSQFKKIFGGFVDYGYLAYAVYGYFSSGGKECVVVRTAHVDQEDKFNSASKASLAFKNINGEEAFRIEAQSEGTWGNFIKIKLWHTNSAAVPVKSVTDSIEIENPDDFTVNDSVCIRSTTKKEYKTISSIVGNRIYFHSPLKEQYDTTSDTVICENVKVNISIIDNKKVEEYNYLSVNPDDNHYLFREINSKSQLISINPAGCIENLFPPEEIFYVNLNGGKNGVLSLIPSDFIGYFNGLDDNRGMGIFEAYPDISLIAAPDAVVFHELIHKHQEEGLDNIFYVQRAMIDQCERLTTRFAILDMPEIHDLIQLLNWRKRFDTAVAASYYPKIIMINPDDITGLTNIAVPPSGHIAGIFVECDEKEGIFRAPANKYIRGAVELTLNVENEEYETLYPQGINCLRYVPGRGIKVWGARTLSSNVSWRFINVRRTFSAISEAIKYGTGWAVFEPNDKKLRKRLIRHVSAFLLDLWHKGYMSGVVPEDGYYVRCDDEINPPEDRDNGIITMEIGLAIARPAEFLVMRIQATSEEGLVVVED